MDYYFSKTVEAFFEEAESMVIEGCNAPCNVMKAITTPHLEDIAVKIQESSKTKL